jgi:hypothetical protein
MTLSLTLVVVEKDTGIPQVKFQLKPAARPIVVALKSKNLSNRFAC